MSEIDKKAQKERAERLRRQISQTEAPAPKTPMSPREFIHKRMRELDKEEKKTEEPQKDAEK